MLTGHDVPKASVLQSILHCKIYINLFICILHSKCSIQWLEKRHIIHSSEMHLMIFIHWKKEVGKEEIFQLKLGLSRSPQCSLIPLNSELHCDIHLHYSALDHLWHYCNFLFLYHIVATVQLSPFWKLEVSSPLDFCPWLKDCCFSL